MSFIYPLAFIGLVAVPAVIFLYLFRNKYTEKVIPSLMLVEQASRMTDSARPWQKLRKNLLLILQLICVILIVLSMAAPIISGEAMANSTIIIIDASMSMGATDADVAPTRLEAAKAAAKALVSGQSFGAGVSIIALTDKPYLAAANLNDSQALNRAIDAVSQTNAEADVEAAASIVRSLLLLAPESEVVLFTDGQEEFPAEARVVLFGESAENCAITLLSAVQAKGSLVCMAKVKNFGTQAVVKTLSLFADQRLAASEEFTLNPGEERTFYFTPESGGEFSARLEPGDILRADDTAYVVAVGSENERRVVYYSRQNSFLHNALAVVPGITLFRGDSSLAASSGYSLYIYDGVLPGELPADGHILLINPPDGNELFVVSGDVSPGKPAVYSHSLTKYIENCDFSVLAAKNITPPENAEVAIGGAAPLLFEYRLDKQLIVVLSFDLHNSDLPLKPEFPVLMYNIIERLIPAHPGGEADISCGDSVGLSISPDSVSVVMQNPLGEKTNLAPPFPVPAFTATGEPGIYRVIQGGSGGSATVSAFAVNTPVSESELGRKAQAAESESQTGRQRIAEGAVNLVPYLIAALLICSLIEWRVYSRAV